jgi:hypothetical protein
MSRLDLGGIKPPFVDPGITKRTTAIDALKRANATAETVMAMDRPAVEAALAYDTLPGDFQYEMERKRLAAGLGAAIRDDQRASLLEAIAGLEIAGLTIETTDAGFTATDGAGRLVLKGAAR